MGEVVEKKVFADTDLSLLSHVLTDFDPFFFTTVSPLLQTAANAVL